MSIRFLGLLLLLAGCTSVADGDTDLPQSSSDGSVDVVDGWDGGEDSEVSEVSEDQSDGLDPSDGDAPVLSEDAEIVLDVSEDSAETEGDTGDAPTDSESPDDSSEEPDDGDVLVETDTPEESSDGEVEVVGTSPGAGDLVFNEVLVRGTVDGKFDPNRDGRSHPMEDEFVELLNTTEWPIELQGCSLSDRLLPGVARHIFEESHVLMPGEVVVLFGGGRLPIPFPGAWFVRVHNGGYGLDLGLHLRDRGNTLSLRSPSGTIVTEFEYGEGTILDQPVTSSFVRSPEGSGEWVLHESVSPTDEPYSPGTQTSGAFFAPQE